jgi:hypothetical protein
MAVREHNWIWFLIPLALVVGATCCEVSVLATGMATGDMIGSPPSFTAEGQQSIRRLQRDGNVAFAGVIVFLALSSLCLGTVLHRVFGHRAFEAYFAGFAVCPLASAILLALVFYIGFHH